MFGMANQQIMKIADTSQTTFERMCPKAKYDKLNRMAILIIIGIIISIYLHKAPFYRTTATDAKFTSPWNIIDRFFLWHSVAAQWIINAISVQMSIFARISHACAAAISSCQSYNMVEQYYKGDGKWRDGQWFSHVLQFHTKATKSAYFSDDFSFCFIMSVCGWDFFFHSFYCCCCCFCYAT